MEARFHKTWEHDRPDLHHGDGRGDHSRYGLALCTLAALAGRSDTELILLIRAHRARRAAEPTKRGKWKREDYVRGTIELARGHAEQQKTGTWWLVSAERNG